jgi:hypothetical protein
MLCLTNIRANRRKSWHHRSRLKGSSSSRSGRVLAEAPLQAHLVEFLLDLLLVVDPAAPTFLWQPLQHGVAVQGVHGPAHRLQRQIERADDGGDGVVRIWHWMSA